MATLSRHHVTFLFLGAVSAGSGGRSTVVSTSHQAATWLATMSEMGMIAETEGVCISDGTAGLGLHEWAKSAETIRQRYQHTDGFVIVHQFETAPAAAWALSCMLPKLGKPVVICGSPTISSNRTSAAINVTVAKLNIIGIKANYINALQVAISDVAEVVVVHGSHIYRGSTVVGPMNAVRGEVLGKIDFGIRFLGRQLPRSSRAPKISSAYEDRVAIAEYLPGVDLRHITAVARGTRALFLSSPEGVDVVRPLLANIKQALPASVLVMLYTPNHELVPSSVVPVIGPSRSAALLKTMCALGQSHEAKSLRHLLAT